MAHVSGYKGSLASLPVREGALESATFVASIDFGTTYSGYAFQKRANFEQEPLKIEANNWGGQGISLKTPSSILFDKDGKFSAFGRDAEDKYNDLAADGQEWDWYYFRRFKMMLYQAENLKRDAKLTDKSRNKSLPAMVVFTEAIRYLKEHLLKSRPRDVKDTQIHWVVTVPAIWDDPAKQFMREAAVKAGISTDKLFLSLEPEAASLFCRYLPVNKVSSIGGGDSIQSFGVGDRYMILDVGGGTVDITVHEVVQEDDDDEITLKELFKANGGDWGGLKVDEAFEELLNVVIGHDVIEIVENRHRADYMELMANFEIKKRGVKPELDTTETIPLPAIMVEMYEELNKEKLDDNSKTLPPKYDKKVSFKGGKMRVHADVLKGLFTETCDQICSLASEYFGQIQKYNVDKILMVGGFSESHMLQDNVRQSFPNKRVIIPEEAGLAVLKGAVLYGHNPSMITARVCKYTYGICALKQYEPALDPRDKRVVKDGFVLCKDHFSVHAKINQECKPGETAGENTYVPSDNDTSELQIDVYTSTCERPRYVDDNTSKKIGEMRVPISSKAGGHDASVSVAFVFGKTELDVVAKEEKTGKETKAYFDFL